LLKYTPKKHPDFVIIEAGLSDIRELADFINQSKKDSQLQSDVLRVHSMLKPSIVMPFFLLCTLIFPKGFGVAPSKVHL
jgi:hypothetical protein